MKIQAVIVNRNVCKYNILMNCDVHIHNYNTPVKCDVTLGGIMTYKLSGFICCWSFLETFFHLLCLPIIIYATKQTKLQQQECKKRTRREDKSGQVNWVSFVTCRSLIMKNCSGHQQQQPQKPKLLQKLMLDSDQMKN